MAFSTGNGSGLGNGGFLARRRGSRGGAAIADINVVPFVDVVLVLLIIFMLTAHVMEFGLEVDVPRVNQVRESAEELPIVTITKTGELYLGESPANIHSLGEEVRRRYPGFQEVYVRADRETIFEPIAQVTSELGRSGLGVRLVTQPADSAYTRQR